MAKEGDISKVAEIHKNEISTSFLTRLGKGFLLEFYKAVIKSDFSFCLVAEEGTEAAGFIAGATDIKKFYSYFIRKHFLAVFFAVLPKIFSPGIVKKVLENIFYSKKENDLFSAELLAIALKKIFQGKGIGSQLLTGFNSEMKNRGVAVFKVLVGKELEKSINFYKKNNFQFFKEIIIHNKKSLIFIYKIRVT